MAYASIAVSGMERNELLPALIECFAAPGAADEALVRQQMITAVALLQIALADGRGPRAAGTQFAAWLRIAVKQSPDLFVNEQLLADGTGILLEKWTRHLRDRPYLETLAIALDAARELFLPVQSGQSLCVLFIGDCLLWDTSLQLQIAARAHGLTVEPTIMAQRLGTDLRSKVLTRKEGEFDLVFYSPFSFEFSSAYSFACSPGSVLRAPFRVTQLLDEALADVALTIETLAARFACPIHVHNVSGVQQSRPDWRNAVKRLASRPSRRLARDRLNAGLQRLIGALNARLDRQIVQIDELGLCGDPPADSLGFIAYDAGELHPTRLATELAAGPYLRAALVAAYLADKKLVVCDLDNTLWDGVIGEGAVTQHHDRQRTLLELKARGVVLAVASKNNPENISWLEATLGNEDFVAQKINWSPKPVNILAIAEQLNLKTSSFIFLDDRPDERAIVAEAIPDLVALDPNDPETWAILGHWAESMPHSAIQDRTKMYRQRAEREDFLNSIAARSIELGETYRKLGLRLSLRHPIAVEMTRVVELINRTNQFNTTAARTTRQEMDETASQRRILVADVQDKFGEMGIVGVLVAEVGDPWRITHFVLSCRVFGFGIEDAMLNSVKRWNGSATRIHAELIDTPINGPCQDVYERNGFCREGTLWKFSEGGSNINPSWLTVDDKTNTCFSIG